MRPLAFAGVVLYVSVIEGLTDPLLQELLFALLDHRLGELKRLGRVELAFLQQHAEIGQDGRRLSGLRRRGLEAGDGIVGA